MVGFVKWQEPRRDGGGEVETGLPEWPAEADGRVCEETFGEWGRRRRELMGRRGHWCKSSISSSVLFSQFSILALCRGGEGRGRGGGSWTRVGGVVALNMQIGSKRRGEARRKGERKKKKKGANYRSRSGDHRYTSSIPG